MSTTNQTSSSSTQNTESLFIPKQPKPELCCSGKKKFEAHISYGGMDDHITVAALPDNILPKRAGQTFIDYLKAQKASHYIILDEMIEKLKEINLEIEGKVQTIAELLRAHVQENKNDMDCIVKNCKDMEPIRMPVKNSAVKEINQLAKERDDDIDWLKQEGMQLERARADKLRHLLRDYFKRLVVLGTYQPHEVLQDFDNRIFEINQQLLSNIRAYAEVEAQLKFQAKEEVVKAKATIYSLATVAVPPNSRSKSAGNKSTDSGSLKRRSNSFISETRGLAADIAADKDILEEGEFDECVARLVDIYKTAVLKVFSGFQIKLEDLVKDLDQKQSVMFSDEKTCETIELQQMIERIVRRLSTIVNHKISSCQSNHPVFMEKARVDAVTMQTCLYSLGEKLRKTYMILHNAGHLWDAHITRLALAQKLTLLAVEDLITNNDTAEMTYDTLINIAMVSIRTAHTPEDAKEAYEEVMLMLDTTAKMYATHSKAEFARLEEFMQLPPVMACTLMAEFKMFLANHPLSHGLAAESTTHQLMTKNMSPRNSYLAYLPLPRAILQTELQALSLQNWRDGFLESLENSASQIPQMLTDHARQWVDERGGALHTRYSLKMISHSIRAERIKGLLDLRLAELQNHSSRLKSHTTAVNEFNENLLRLADYFDIQCPRLYPLVEKATAYQVKIDALTADEEMNPEVKRLKLISYLPRLEGLLQSFLASVVRVGDEITLEIEQLVQATRISNVRFLSRLTMFHEGGLYNASEALDTANALQEASAEIETTSDIVSTLLHDRRHELEAMATNLVTELQNNIREHIQAHHTGHHGTHGGHKKKKEG